MNENLLPKILTYKLYHILRDNLTSRGYGFFDREAMFCKLNPVFEFQTLAIFCKRRTHVSISSRYFYDCSRRTRIEGGFLRTQRELRKFTRT